MQPLNNRFYTHNLNHKILHGRLSAEQIEVVSKYLDLIIPKTEDIPGATELGLHTVSYTHLTLPTNREV